MANEYKLFGDAHPVEYGGNFIRQSENPDFPNNYEFFKIIVDDEENKYAFSGIVMLSDDYKEDFEQIKKFSGIDETFEQLMAENPEMLVSELLDNYGCGVWEFSPRNYQGTGQYSMDMECFKIDTETLAEFMKEQDIPEEFIPSPEYKVVSYYDGDYRGVEDSIETVTFEKAQEFAHEKLMQGNSVIVTEIESGEEAKINADKYQDTFELRNGEFPISADDFEVDYGDSEENLEME